MHVLINSLGGDTDTALSISSLFKLHGNVSVHFVGMNASAATIAAMGAKHVSIDADALFLVHKCSVLVFEWDYMNADELSAHIAELEKMKDDNSTIDACVAGMYAKRCKKTKDELLALMKTGAWMTAQQALEWGFVDEITDSADDKKPEPSSATVASMVSAGIPLPPNFHGKKGSIMERFLSFLQSPFSTQAPGNDNAGAAKHSPIMPKLTALSSLLGATLAMSDDKLSLSAEQAAKVCDTLDGNAKTIDSLNSSVADKDKEIADLKASVAEKDKTIADLRKEPAAPTSGVVDTDKETDPYAPVSEADALAASKAFMESSI